MIPQSPAYNPEHHTQPLLRRGVAALALIGVALVCSCSTIPTAGYVSDEFATVYLPGYSVAPPATQAGPVDTVSYWDGDGATGPPAITIDLSQQRAFFFKGDKLVGVSRISSGDAEHKTPPGNFKITEKDVDHRSNLYGDYVDSAGNVVMRDIAVLTDPRPAGTTFRGAPMMNFMRFNNGIGMHAGFLPGYAASHGCVRMPEQMAKVFYNNVDYGTPVRVVE